MCNCTKIAGAQAAPAVGDLSYLIFIVAGFAAIMALAFFLCEILSKTQKLGFINLVNRKPNPKIGYPEPTNDGIFTVSEIVDEKQKKNKFVSMNSVKERKLQNVRAGAVNAGYENEEDILGAGYALDGPSPKPKPFSPGYTPVHTRTIPSYPLSGSLVSQARMPWRMASTMSSSAASAASISVQSNMSSLTSKQPIQSVPLANSVPPAYKGLGASAHSRSNSPGLSSTTISEAEIVKALVQTSASAGKLRAATSISVQSNMSSALTSKQSIQSVALGKFDPVTSKVVGASVNSRSSSPSFSSITTSEAEVVKSLVQNSVPPKPKRLLKQEETENGPEIIDHSPATKDVKPTACPALSTGPENTEMTVKSCNGEYCPVCSRSPTGARISVRRPWPSATKKLIVLNRALSAMKPASGSSHNGSEVSKENSTLSATVVNQSSNSKDILTTSQTTNVENLENIKSTATLETERLQSSSASLSTSNSQNATHSASSTSVSTNTTRIENQEIIQNGFMTHSVNTGHDSKTLAHSIMTRLFRGQQESELLFQQIKSLENKMDLITLEFGRSKEIPRKMTQGVQTTEPDEIQPQIHRGQTSTTEYVDFEVSRGYQIGKPPGIETRTQVISLEALPPKWPVWKPAPVVHRQPTSIPPFVHSVVLSSQTGRPSSIDTGDDSETLSLNSNSPDFQKIPVLEVQRSGTVQMNSIHSEVTATREVTPMREVTPLREVTPKRDFIIREMVDEELWKREYDKRLKETVATLQSDIRQRQLEDLGEQRYLFLKRETELQKELGNLNSTIENQGSVLSNMQWKLNKFEKNITTLADEKLLLETCAREVKTGWEADKKTFAEDKLRLEGLLHKMKSERQDLVKNFDHLVGVRVALDSELKKYRALVEEEEQRLPFVVEGGPVSEGAFVAEGGLENIKNRGMSLTESLHSVSLKSETSVELGILPVQLAQPHREGIENSLTPNGLNENLGFRPPVIEQLCHSNGDNRATPSPFLTQQIRSSDSENRVTSPFALTHIQMENENRSMSPSPYGHHRPENENRSMSPSPFSHNRPGNENRSMSPSPFGHNRPGNENRVMSLSPFGQYHSTNEDPPISSSPFRKHHPGNENLSISTSPVGHHRPGNENRSMSSSPFGHHHPGNENRSMSSSPFGHHHPGNENRSMARSPFEQNYPRNENGGMSPTPPGPLNSGSENNTISQHASSERTFSFFTSDGSLV